MAIERCFSLRKAAKLLGVGQAQLKRMLLVELQMVLPQVPHRSRQMIRESVLHRLIDKKGPKVDLMLLRPPSKRRARP
jgi:hypothetical protein